MAINSGNSVFSSGPEITQRTPSAQRTPVIPTEYGLPVSNSATMAGKTPIPVMGINDSAFSSADGRVSEIPAFSVGNDSFGDKVEFAPKAPHISNKNDPKDPSSSTMRGKGLSALHEAPKAPAPKAEDEVPDDSDMSMVEDAHPIKPYHDVLRKEGYKASHSERKGDTRINHYEKENAGGGKERVELHHNQGRGPEFGSTNSVTHSGDPEGNSPRVNNSPEKLHRNIHAQSYRKPEGVPSKMKPQEVREYAKKIKE